MPGLSARLRDAALQQAVIDQLAAEDTLSTTTIGVEVTRGVVRLVGTVHTPSDREDAEAAVRRVAGVLTVLDELTVERGL